MNDNYLLIGLRAKVEEYLAAEKTLHDSARRYWLAHEAEMPGGMLLDVLFDSRGVSWLFIGQGGNKLHFITLETLAEFEAQNGK